MSGCQHELYIYACTVTLQTGTVIMRSVNKLTIVQYVVLVTCETILMSSKDFSMRINEFTGINNFIIVITYIMKANNLIT